jgi:inner membrane protein
LDSITHIVLGAAIGEAILGKKLGKRGMLWGAITNSLPDIDVLANFFTNPVDALLIHRGLTHSFFFAIVLSPLLAFVFYKPNLKNFISYKNWLLFFLIAIIAHDVIDVCTAYGTGLLEPFSHQRFSTNSIFVADPFYTLPLLLSFFILLILKNNSEKRKLVNKLGLYLSSAYLVFTFLNKSYVNSVTLENLKNQHISYSQFVTTPAPLSNILWYIIAKTDSGFYMGYYSIFDKSKNIGFRYFPSNEQLISAFPPAKSLEKLKFFAHDYYIFTEKDNKVFFNDLRFGQAVGWATTTSKFVFSYNIRNETDNLIVISRTNTEISWGKAFRSLIQRINGN